jgi:hypothetical protein
MKRCLAAFAIAASLFATLGVQAADDALMDKVRINVPIYTLLPMCDLRAINAATNHDAVLAAVKSDPEALALLRRLIAETQATYLKARDASNRLAFCRDFIAANSEYAKARVTAVTEGYFRIVNARVRGAIGHDLCNQGEAVKLRKADREDYELMRRVLQVERKVVKEVAELKGWNVADEMAEVTEQFCEVFASR